MTEKKFNLPRKREENQGERPSIKLRQEFLIVIFLDDVDPVLFIYARKSDPRGLTEVLFKYKQPSFDGLAGVRVHDAIRWSLVRVLVLQRKNYKEKYQSKVWKLQLITCTPLLKKGLKKFEHIFF